MSGHITKMASRMTMGAIIRYAVRLSRRCGGRFFFWRPGS